MIALGITFALLASALPSTGRPEVFLAGATGGVIAFGLLTFWLGGAYAVAAALTIVAWVEARTVGGPSFARQLAVAVTCAVSVFALFLIEGILSDVVFEYARTSG